MTDQQDTPQENTFEDRVNDLVERLDVTYKSLRSIISEVKTLKKEHARIVKKASGGRRKKTRDPNAPKKAPSGFAKPTKISRELADFIGVNEGEMITRPEVTRLVSKYIKENKLQNEEDGRVIHLDRPGGEKLAKILNVPVTQELTYFNLQRFMTHQFPKGETTDAPAATETAKTETKAPRRRRRTAAAAN